MSTLIKIFFWLISFTIWIDSQSQIKIKAAVFDHKTREPIEFVSIYCKKNQTGGSSDATGNVSFTISKIPDTLIVSMIGYITIKYLIEIPPSQKLVFYMDENQIQLTDAEVNGYKDPGKHILKEVLSHRRDNDINRFDNSICNEYRKMEIDITNLTPDNRNGFFSRIAKLYNYEMNDSNGVDAPIYFEEKYLRNYKSSKLQTNIDHLVADKKLGLSTDNIAPAFSKFEFKINIYNPSIPILKIPFISPVSELGLIYYKFKIIDTTILNNKRIFKIKMTPKLKNENTFEGLLWIEDETFSITKYQLNTNPGNNLNFIRSISFDADFIQMADTNKARSSFWLPYKFSSTIFFENGLELLGIPIESDTSGIKVILKNTSFFNNYTVNNQNLTQDNFFADLYLNLPKTKSNDTLTFIDTFRTEKLTLKEQAIYNTVDSLKKKKWFVTEMKLTSFFATGYWEFGNKLRIGPYSSFISTNALEGVRLRCSFWTLPGVSRTFNYNAHIAYGFKDKTYKGSFGIKYVPIAKRYMKTEFKISTDYDLVNDFDDVMDNDNVFTLALRKNVPAYMVYKQQARISQEIDLNHNWSAVAFGVLKSLTPSFDYNYYKIEDDNIVNYTSLKKLNASEVGFTLRYAHNERTTFLNYDKIRISSLFPIFSFQYTFGFELLPNDYFNYHKFVFNLTQELMLPFKGSLFYYASVGKMYGKVPAILLFAPLGNAYYIANKYMFNNMLPYEFASDEYASILMRYNMGGLILDKIPLLNKLKFRERFIFNAYLGNLTKSNAVYNNINNIKTTGNTPYTEAGVGVGNIFKVISVDAIWRMSQFDPLLKHTRFGIYTSLVVQF